MNVPLLKGLSEEKVVLLKPKDVTKFHFLLNGIVRLVDGKGHTLGIVLDKEVMDEIEEEMEASDPDFLASLETSRRSGRVPGAEVKKKIGMR
jgi:hypothetical protein